MTIIIAPADLNEVNWELPSAFLAGGITGCTDWQAAMIGMLDEPNRNILSPRRPEDTTWQWTAEGSRAQIEWEQKALKLSDIVPFWFDADQVQPIAMYELGRFTHGGHPLFVGCHPDYPRRFDVVTQLSLLRPEVQVVDNLLSLAAQVEGWFQDWAEAGS